MNRKTDNERLLAEVLSHEPAQGFTEALLVETLRAVRRRQQWRRARRIGGGLALVVVLGLALWPASIHRVAPKTAYQLVVSQPLLPGQLVTTSRGATEQVSSSALALVTVRTANGGYHEVGDDELLALAAPQIVALVKRGPHEAELIIVPPPAVTSN